MLNRSIRFLAFGRVSTIHACVRRFGVRKFPLQTKEIVETSKLTKVFNFGVKHGTNIVTWVPLIIRDGPKIAVSLAVCGSVGYLYYLKKSYHEKYDAIKTSISDRYNKIVDGVSTKINGVKDACSSAVSKIRSYATDSYHKSIEKVGNIFSKSKEILGKLNPISLIKEKASAMKNKTTEIFQSALSKLKKPEKIKDSPENQENTSIIDKINPVPFLKDKSSKLKDKAVEVKDSVKQKALGVKDKVLGTQKEDDNKTVTNGPQNAPPNTTNTNTTNTGVVIEKTNEPPGKVSKLKEKLHEKLSKFKNRGKNDVVTKLEGGEDEQKTDEK